MKIEIGWSPNWEEIQVLTPYSDAIFCFGDTIYNPSGEKIPEDIQFHELVHSERQGINPKLWWIKYIKDEKFRLEEELHAFSLQYFFVKKYIGTKAAKECLEEAATNLSSPWYNLSINYHQAHSKIRFFIRNHVEISL